MTHDKMITEIFSYAPAALGFWLVWQGAKWRDKQ